MKYNVEFLEELSKTVDVYLILEKGETPIFPHIKNLKNIKTRNTINRIFKTLKFLLDAKKLGYKKVYVHYSFSGAFIASLIPGLEVYYWNCGIPWKYKRPFFQELYESSTYKLIDHFVTGAEILIPKYCDYYNFNNSKGVVIPNWIDNSHVKSILDGVDRNKIKQELNIQNQKVLFFNQRLAERKGAHYIPEILSAAAKTMADEKNIVLIITNDGPYKQKLIDKLKQENLFEKVRILGRVPNEKVIEILSITDLYILPSEEEGMSHSLMEAMSCGVPAVSYDVGGTRDMYPENFKEYVVPEKNISWFNEKVGELLADENKRAALGQAFLEKVKMYDKKIVLEEFKAKIF
jgi:glycosyltransferase involved in cell wall biosynthesis